MLRASDKVAILAISEKMNTIMKMKIADIQDVDYLITELPPDAPELLAYENIKIEVL